jgi:hypothetical protein
MIMYENINKNQPDMPNVACRESKIQLHFPIHRQQQHKIGLMDITQRSMKVLHVPLNSLELQFFLRRSNDYQILEKKNWPIFSFLRDRMLNSWFHTSSRKLKPPRMNHGSSPPLIYHIMELFMGALREFI